ncbi:hypothetical protein EYZ11_005423 [Aspergillus tanneri]|uniref:Uncharacterized protein n=1 Tax=Aspergillus tanneri TaxID=1220188 RepID=A0A4S3JHZ0_9EURO|nr:hypothetical protein EYZ11_005423 [Aspergillus tanneri]
MATLACPMSNLRDFIPIYSELCTVIKD